MNKQPKIAYVLAVLRVIFGQFLIFLCAFLTHFVVFRKLFSGMMDDGVMPPSLVLSYCAILYLVIFFLFTRLFATYHMDFRKECPLCKRGHAATIPQKILLLFKTPSFLLALITAFAFILLIPYASVGKYVAEILFGAAYTYDEIMLATLIFLPVLLLLYVFSYLAAARNIRNEGPKDKSVLSKQFDWRFANLFLGSLAVPILLPILIIVASQFLIFLVFFPAIITAVLVFCALRYIRALRIRRKFLRQLKETCRKNRYYLSKIQKPYRSLFFITDGISFSIKDKNGKQYDCKLLHSIKRTAPMFFHSDGFATLVSPVNFFKAELFYRIKTMPYSFESENQKCIIVCPIPRAFYARNESSESEVDSAVTESKMIFAGIGGGMKSGGLYEAGLPKNARSRELDIGDSFNNYKFYNATGFLNAIEFNVFDR